MYLYTLKQLKKIIAANCQVVNRFKKNVSLHVETTVTRAKVATRAL